MNQENFLDKAKGLAEEHKDTIEAALKSDQAEQISDKVLDGLADAANKATGGKHADKVQEFRDAADKKIGNE